jgi:Helix-turn-helix domain
MRSIRTLKRRDIILKHVRAGRSIAEAATRAGIGRRTVYEWRDADPDFRAELDSAVVDCVDRMEGKLQTLALKGDITALIFMLRSRKPEIYNPNLVLRREMLRLALDKAKSDAAPMIEGTVTEDGMPTNLHPITIFQLPWNGRQSSPHQAIGEYGEPGQLVPAEQDGTGLTMPLPRSVQVELHPGDELPAHMVADGVSVPPEAATDLWRRVKAWNHLLAIAYPEAMSRPRQRGYADGWSTPDQPEMSDDRPDDDDPAMRGFGATALE